MDHLVLQPTWTGTTAMAIELCGGRKYYVKPQPFVYLLRLMATTSKFEGHACVMLGILFKGGILVVHELLHIQGLFGMAYVGFGFIYFAQIEALQREAVL